jgi:cytochrome c-type biogenesis protein CcmH/NrfG
MIDFWLPAGLLLLTALAFLLIPVLRIRKLQAEEDRTALNVTLYQERLQELENQLQAGVLDVWSQNLHGLLLGVNAGLEELADSGLHVHRLNLEFTAVRHRRRS